MNIEVNILGYRTIEANNKNLDLRQGKCPLTLVSGLLRVNYVLITFFLEVVS